MLVPTSLRLLLKKNKRTIAEGYALCVWALIERKLICKYCRILYMNMSHLFERLRLMLAVLGSGFHSEKHSVFSWN